MNPVLLLTHNCLDLTKKCVESIAAQDIPVQRIRVFDNYSTDGTQQWIMNECPFPYVVPGLALENKGVSYAWNGILRQEFEKMGSEHVLVVNNDTILPSFFYRSLLEYDVPFVTGVSVNDMAAIAEPQPKKELVEAPDFSAFLIRKSAWDLVGPFDEAMVSYASDCDWHVRAHRAGLPLWNAGVHFYHERSSTIKHADKREQRELCLQADADREVFKERYGCLPGDQKYAELFR